MKNNDIFQNKQKWSQDWYYFTGLQTSLVVWQYKTDSHIYFYIQSVAMCCFGWNIWRKSDLKQIIELEKGEPHRKRSTLEGSQGISGVHAFRVAVLQPSGQRLSSWYRCPPPPNRIIEARVMTEQEDQV